MRLNPINCKYVKDDSGLVMAFTALILPIILLLSVLVIQSGQLYLRQAQLQFLARQTAISGLVPVTEIINQQAQKNWQGLCLTELPPAVCASNRWSDFISAAELQTLLNAEGTYQAVELEVEDFAQTSDPQKQLSAAAVTFEFPFVDSQGRASLKVQLAETQTGWIGNVLRPEDYEIQVQSLSYLSQT